jgi:aminopeptidase N
MVLLSSTLIGTRTIAHEMAHMWFGDWVSLDSWGEMWRNEGFATYIQIMWETQDDPEAMELQMESARSQVAANELNFPLGNPPPEYLFNFNVYYGGAVVVHELRQQLGDEAFFAGLRLYFERYGGGTASDADFQAVMEEASGQSLDAFFAEWVPRS